MGPRRTEVDGLEKRGAGTELPGDHLPWVERVDRQARLGILLALGAGDVRDNIDDAEIDDGCHLTPLGS